MDDDELIAAMAAGDDRAVRELYSRHAPWLAARLRRVVPPAVVEDVLQETFVGAWRGASGYRPQQRAGAWLWGIARRQAALWVRRNGRPPATAHPPDAVAAMQDPEAIAVGRAELSAAVASLGPPGSAERELWRLLFEDDRPIEEVAMRLGVPHGTVKSRAWRIRRLLRSALSGSDS